MPVFLCALNSNVKKRFMQVLDWHFTLNAAPKHLWHHLKNESNLCPDSYRSAKKNHPNPTNPFFFSFFCCRKQINCLPCADCLIRSLSLAKSRGTMFTQFPPRVAGHQVLSITPDQVLLRFGALQKKIAHYYSEQQPDCITHSGKCGVLAG